MTSITLASPGAAALLWSPARRSRSFPAAVGSRPRQLRHPLPQRRAHGGPKGLTIKASDQTKIYGRPFIFDETTPWRTSRSPASKLGHGDEITLASPGAAAAALVSGSPFTIVPSARSVPASPTTTSTTRRARSRGPRPSTIKATNQTKTYGRPLHLRRDHALADFTVTGLINSDTVTDSRSRARAPRPLLSSPARRSRSFPRRRSGPASPTTHPLRHRRADRQPQRPDDQGHQPDEDLRPDRHLRRDHALADFTVTGLNNSDTVTTITLASPARRPLLVAGSPFTTVPARGRYRPRQLHIDYDTGALTVNRRRRHDQGHRPDEDLRPDLFFDETTPRRLHGHRPQKLGHGDLDHAREPGCRGHCSRRRLAVHDHCLGGGRDRPRQLHIDYDNGALTVTRALTIKATDQTKTYGQTSSPSTRPTPSATSRSPASKTRTR